MQTYAIKMFNFLRFGEKNNTVVFDLTEIEKEQIALGNIKMDDIYNRVLSDPITHVKEVKERGVEGMLGITGIINGDPDSSNGSGKSSIMEAMCYARYDRVARRTINSDNKEKAGLSTVTRIDNVYPENLRESYVEEIIEDDGIIYRIKRGRSFTKTQKNNSPIVEIECYNKDERDKRGGHRSGDTKDAISEVITMDYDVFVNSQMFAQNDAGKFLMGTDKTKKEMMISLLNLENVVAGCLELLRSKKRNQEKTVENIRSKIAVMKGQFETIKKELFPVPSIADDSNTFEEIAKVIFRKLKESCKDIEAEIIAIDEELIVIDEEYNSLAKSDEIERLNTIKEKGKLIKTDKEAKEKAMADNKKKWDDLIVFEQKEQKNNDAVITSSVSATVKKTNQIDEARKKIKMFDEAKSKQDLEYIEKAKVSKPKFESQLVKGNKLRDKAISDIAGIQSNIKLVDESIRKFTKQLDHEEDHFVCSECESVVPRKHVESKLGIATTTKNELSLNLITKKSELKNINEKINLVKDKILKCTLYMQKEDSIRSSMELKSVLSKQVELAEAEIVELNKTVKNCENVIKTCVCKIKEHEANMANELKDAQIEIDKSKNEIEKLRKEFQEASTSTKGIKEKLLVLRKKKEEHELDKSKKTKLLGSLAQKEDNVENLKTSIDTLLESLETEEEELARYKILEGVYGLSGIQTRIIKKYLPLLNVYIKEFLDILTNGEMGVRLFINEFSKVDLAITGGTSDTYEMLSGGEKMVVRLATDIGLALLSFARSAQKPEVICLDEIFGPLDNDRTASVFKMLEHLREKFSRVLIITHKNDIKDLIPANIIVEKKSGRLGISEVKTIE